MEQPLELVRAQQWQSR